jgi:predicted nucleic acid-binding protein
MKLVDTSSWIHQLRRRGDPAVRARVEGLLVAGEAAWCAPVRLELWAGVGGDKERRALREYEAVLPDLPVTDEVWQEAHHLADRCRREGDTASAMDLLIAACARHYGVGVETADRDFERLLK